MLNNLSEKNIEEYALLISKKLNAEHYDIFSEYFIANKVSLEGNYFDLYLEFYKKLTNRNLKKSISESTYKVAKVFFQYI